MGIIANVYRSSDGYDCTNGGPSFYVNRVCIVNVDGPFNPSDDAPAAMLMKHPAMNHVFLRFEEHVGKQAMMGGNFVHCSDSRFGEQVRYLLDDYKAFVGAVPIHDRIE